MVDLSVNCSLQLMTNDRGVSLDAKMQLPLGDQKKPQSESGESGLGQSEHSEEHTGPLSPTTFFYRPSLSRHDALSEGDRADEDDEVEEDEEEEWEYEECEEEAEEARDGDKDKKKRFFSASRSPAPERVDGAQAELDAEVEISEVIALRMRNASMLHCPSMVDFSFTNANAGNRKVSMLRNPSVFASFLFPQQSVKEDEEAPQLASVPEEPTETAHVDAAEGDPEDHKMMKRFLVPLCTIGTGAFGRVQLCQHRRNGKYYALKSMYMPTVIERRQVEHVHQEKRILQTIVHPFIVRLWDTAKDRCNLYMVMEFLPGGELFSYFRALRKFSTTVVKFYSAEILLALEYLHSKHIAYRDLKPENLMVNLHGHIKLTDFGFAKLIHNKSYTLCGTPGYLAPEVFERVGHNQSVDYWALGVLIFELMAGEQPFRGRCPEDVYESIQASKENGMRFPRRTFSPNAKHVIRGLLCVDPKRRMGCDELKRHPWYAQYEWQELYNRNYKPPFVPTIYHDGDTGNFDSYQEVEELAPAKQCELDLFDEW